MRRLSSLLLVFALCTTCFGGGPPEQHKFKHQHRASHWIIEEDDAIAAGCTATAIGPHALITAEHCDLSRDADHVGAIELYLDPVDVPKRNTPTPWRIVGKVLDGRDHMILYVAGPAFGDTVDISNNRAPVQGEKILFWGNPAGVRDQFRMGYVMGDIEDQIPFQEKPGDLWFVATPVVGGDSGSLVLDSVDGHIVGIVTYGINGGQFMGMFTLNFTPEQIQAARGFNCKDHACPEAAHDHQTFSTGGQSYRLPRLSN